MKKIALVLLIAFLSGCSSPPVPPEPKGEWTPVNNAGANAHV
ncbi:hypothetical protein O3J91_06590 [Yersinia pestis]|nr:hypothetical protein [Yersinia pestis]MDL1129155.1 hypothetical protein [Yersinia pestis]